MKISTFSLFFTIIAANPEFLKQFQNVSEVKEKAIN